MIFKLDFTSRIGIHYFTPIFPQICECEKPAFWIIRGIWLPLKTYLIHIDLNIRINISPKYIFPLRHAREYPKNFKPKNFTKCCTVPYGQFVWKFAGEVTCWRHVSCLLKNLQIFQFFTSGVYPTNSCAWDIPRVSSSSCLSEISISNLPFDGLG